MVGADANDRLIIAQLTCQVARQNPAALRSHVASVENFLDDGETCSVALNTLKLLATYLRGGGGSYFYRVRKAVGDNSRQHGVVETLKAIGALNEVSFFSLQNTRGYTVIFRMNASE